jgi:hypothetical protein
VLATNTEPAFPVKPTVKKIVSDPASAAFLTKKCGDPAGDAKMLEGIKARLYVVALAP